MPIESRDELIRLLGQVRELSERDRNSMIDTANFMPDGSAFFRSAHAFMLSYGDRDDEEVYYHYRETGFDPPADPCEPQEYYSCWVKKNRGRKPPINRPFPR
jgi:hypothetical protein